MKHKNNIETIGDLEIKFKEFKLGDKIGYYMILEDINYYLDLKKNRLYKIVRSVRTQQGREYVIKYSNSYYLSQYGYEKLIELYNIRKNVFLKDLILDKYRSKNMKENNLWTPKEKGLQPVISNNIIFRVIDKRIFISTNSIVKKTGIGLNDLNSKCKREYYFDKDNVRIGTSDKKKNITSYLLSEIAYKKIVGLDNKEILNLYSKEIK